MYRRRRFDAEIIKLYVRWYITYRLSYRDLVAMMAERSVIVSHTTIHRWVIRYLQEFEKRWNRFARPVNTPWRVDETYIRIRGKWNFLYRAVDKHGTTVDFLFAGEGISNVPSRVLNRSGMRIYGPCNATVPQQVDRRQNPSTTPGWAIPPM